MASSSAPAARRLLTARVCTTCMRCGAAVAVGDRIVPTESEDARRCLYLHPACAAALAQDKGLEELPMPVCKHWRSKGFCLYMATCAFSHPEGARGALPPPKAVKRRGAAREKALEREGRRRGAEGDRDAEGAEKAEKGAGAEVGGERRKGEGRRRGRETSDGKLGKDVEVTKGRQGERAEGRGAAEGGRGEDTANGENVPLADRPSLAHANQPSFPAPSSSGLPPPPPSSSLPSSLLPFLAPPRKPRNRFRAGALRRWLLDSFGAAALAPGSGVLDVAAGKGELSFELRSLNGFPATALEPRPLELARFERMFRRGYYGFNEQFRRYNLPLSGRAEDAPSEPQAPAHLRALATPRMLRALESAAAANARDAEGMLLEPEDWAEAYEASQRAAQDGLGFASGGGVKDHPETSPPSPSPSSSPSVAWRLLASCSAIVGMHPDGAMMWIPAAARALGVPWAVVPCCASGLVEHLGGGGNDGAYRQLVQMLRRADDHTIEETLPFEGRNVVVAGPGGRGWGENIARRDEWTAHFENGKQREGEGEGSGERGRLVDSTLRIR